MHTEMWQHPATRDNVATLRRRGRIVDLIGLNAASASLIDRHAPLVGPATP